MKVKITETGQNERKIEMVVEGSDFSSALNEKLKTTRAQTNLKGFRAGKTPMSFIKRTYGKQYAAEVIGETTMKLLNQILDENQFELIEIPILTDSRVPALEDGALDGDCNFTYYAGLKPKIELKGITKSDNYDYHEIIVEKKEIDEQISGLQKRLGEQVEADTIESNDRLQINAVELEGDTPKETGHESSFQIAVDLIGDDELAEKILSLSKGDEFKFNINSIERDRNEEYIRKYFLQLEEDNPLVVGEEFRGTIEKINRNQPAEINETFFTKAFGDEVTTEEQAREKIKGQIATNYKAIGDNMLIKEVLGQIIEINPFELPENFIHHSLHANGHQIHSVEELDKYRASVRRQIVLSLLLKKLNIKITQDDLRNKILDEFAGNFGGIQLPPEALKGIMGSAMNDEKYMRDVSDRIQNDRIIRGIKGEVSLIRVGHHKDDLLKIYDEAFPKDEEE